MNTVLYSNREITFKHNKFSKSQLKEINTQFKITSYLINLEKHISDYLENNLIVFLFN